MDAAKLRQRYIEYFVERGHRHVPSASLVPDDPTLLFTSAGMVQFKDIFSGRVAPPYPTAVSSQKCFRTTDIESVGTTAFHHTFFEMLGNFSFGDYFKEGVIRHAWAFVTSELGLDPERLWVSVFEEDDDAYTLWRDLIGLAPERIHRLGKEHNWWGPVGDGGPCGPDSEIFYDMGEDAGCGEKCRLLACDCDRFSEIWNLVFMQFDADAAGGLRPLKRASVDTGMGLERTTAVLQGVSSNFDTDLFRPIVETVERLAGEPLEGARRQARDVVADHVRGVVALLADGVRPSNEKQGYVLRRVLRRAVRAAQRLGLGDGALVELIEPVVATLGSAYPEIAAARPIAERIIAQEEAAFLRTLRDGESRLEDALRALDAGGSREVPGRIAFELYDTYGFPVELTAEVAADRGMTVDRSGFDEEMARQRARSRSRGRSSDASSSDDLPSGLPPTEFLGYDCLEAEEVVRHTQEADGVRQLVFDASPFYAAGGGQVTDLGSIVNLSRTGRARVVGVERSPEGVVVHRLDEVDGAFEVGDRCRLEVDPERRRRIERNHTATHLLHQALKRVLGDHATQAGSSVTPAELRFDFAHYAPLTTEEIRAVEDLVNTEIRADRVVATREEELHAAIALGAEAHFAEEYRGKESVRVVSVGEFSMELCAGTHVRRSGEIGVFRILVEEGIAAGTRRIRAATGDAVIARMRSEEAILDRLRERLGPDPEEGLRRIEDELADARKREQTEKEQEVRSLAAELAGGAETVGAARLVVARVDDVDGEQLKRLADEVIERLPHAAVVLAGVNAARAAVVCKCDAALAAVSAREIVAAASRRLGGGGGGSPQFAQGGGSDASAVDGALDEARETLRTALGG